MTKKDQNNLNELYTEAAQRYDYKKLFPVDTSIGAKNKTEDEHYQDIKKRLKEELSKINDHNNQSVSFGISKQFLGPFCEVKLQSSSTEPGGTLKVLVHRAGLKKFEEIDFDQFFKPKRVEGRRLMIQLVKKAIKQQQKTHNIPSQPPSKGFNRDGSPL